MGAAGKIVRRRGSGSPDPVRLEVFHQLLAAVCEEAGALLCRSAVSPNIRERRDFSCALFDADAQLIAQAAHIPVHLGSAGDSVRAVVDSLDLERGDVAILNDPYRGGTHLPDVTMVRPVFVEPRGKRPSFFVVNRAHHADIGGAVPGSMGVAADLIAEGVVIPPVKLRRAGRLDDGVLALLRANVRCAEERVVDFRAQEASLARADERVLALVAEHGERVVRDYAGHLMDYAERLTRAAIAELPAGTFTARDEMDDDGLGNGPFPLRLRLTIARDRLAFDYRDAAPQAAGGINCNRSIVLAASVYVLRCLCPERLPTNEGLFRCVDVATTRGTVLDPEPGAPVAGGNVETSQRLVDLGLQALARAVPGRVPACSAGTMSNLTLGAATARDGGFAFYETLPGGAGAGPHGAGASAVQTHMTNTRNTPVEELERRYPVRVERLTVRRNSGGRGARRGGDGLVKEITALAPAAVAVFCDRQRRGPPGAARGGEGRAGRVSRVDPRGRRTRVDGKTSFVLAAGERIIVETPGGGGHGRPRPGGRR